MTNSKPYRICNLNTQYPFDYCLEEKLEKLIYSTYLDYITEVRSPKKDGFLGIEIFFIDESGFKEVKERGGMDAFGVYIGHYTPFKREVIFIYPEKIMVQSKTILKGQAKLSLNEIYETLLLAVILHELAHAFMAIKSDHNDGRTDWQRHCNKEDEPENGPPSGTSLYALPEGEWIEESLANAFVLVHKFNRSEKAMLKKLIKSQRNGCADGLKWKGKPDRIVATMKSWKKFQDEFGDEMLEILRYSNIKPLEIITNSLTNGKLKNCDFSDSNTIPHVNDLKVLLTNHFHPNSDIYNNALENLSKCGLIRVSDKKNENPQRLFKMISNLIEMSTITVNRDEKAHKFTCRDEVNMEECINLAKRMGFNPIMESSRFYSKNFAGLLMVSKYEIVVLLSSGSCINPAASPA